MPEAEVADSLTATNLQVPRHGTIRKDLILPLPWACLNLERNVARCPSYGKLKHFLVWGRLQFIERHGYSALCHCDKLHKGANIKEKVFVCLICFCFCLTLLETFSSWSIIPFPLGPSVVGSCWGRSTFTSKLIERRKRRDRVSNILSRGMLPWTSISPTSPIFQRFYHLSVASGPKAKPLAQPLLGDTCPSHGTWSTTC